MQEIASTTTTSTTTIIIIVIVIIIQCQKFQPWTSKGDTSHKARIHASDKHGTMLIRRADGQSFQCGESCQSGVEIDEFALVEVPGGGGGGGVTVVIVVVVTVVVGGGVVITTTTTVANCCGVA